MPFDAARPLRDYPGHAITEYPTENGPADYALVVGGHLLARCVARYGPSCLWTKAERLEPGPIELIQSSALSPGQ